MPINVISKLEAISGYRHLGQPGGGGNPTVFSHQIVSLGGQRHSIVSRIADYGSDYSGRSNKLAHHVIVESHERPPAGPAWLLRQRSVMRSEWLGNCETPGTGPNIPSGDQSGNICTTWKNVTGDAGWGGVVAEAIASSNPDPLWIVFPVAHHDQLLSMVDESIALLPPSSRWSATFNTFAANIPPDVQCKVRFVPAGSQEARFAAGSKASIDLTKRPSITSASQWVERARGTQRPNVVRPVADAGGGTFTAVQDVVEDSGMASSWEVEDEVATPPPPPGPPELPPEILNPKSRMPLYVGGGVAGGLLLLSLTWVVARSMAGLPLLPGGAEEPKPLPPVVVEREKPKEKPPAPIPDKPFKFKVYFDQQQMLAWALTHPEEDAEFPNPIELRGGLRLPPIQLDEGTSAEADDEKSANTEEDDQTSSSPESEASLYSWGGDATSFPDVAEIIVRTTRLSGGRQTMTTQRLNQVPNVLGGEIFWNRETGDLIAFLEREWSPASSEPLAAPYRSATRALARVTELMLSIKENQAELPSAFQNLAEPLVAKTLRGEESMMRSLMRSPDAASAMADLAKTLNTALQERIETSTIELSRSQQTRLVRIVAQCGELAQAATDLRKAFTTLKTGLQVEVPDLKFHDRRGRVLRHVPLRFTLSF